MDADVGGAAAMLRGVSKRFGDRLVLRDIDLRLGWGEVTVVLGPSGSGKSTLCRTINGLETIDSGEIVVTGHRMPSDARGLAELRADVGMVFQSFNLFARRTVLENVMLGPVRVRRRSVAEATERARTVLDRVGLLDQADKLPVELSGGQQQRVAIARALAMDPVILLFDEPTSALDRERAAEVLDVMTGLAEGGMTMMVVTHELAFARQAAHRVVFLDGGRIVETGRPVDFFTAPRTRRVREFLGRAEPRP
ncbi:MAG: amino acid ABC transporter ATP-binding protein [Propionibacteriaceae bacterium]|nr:amino acid ABC transporter ATP-binding protein [Propionibacteriaceae bacterium]